MVSAVRFCPSANLIIIIKTINQKLPASLIISISGIRGIVGKDFDRATVKTLLYGYVQLLGKGLFVLAGDSRSHTPKIQQWVADELVNLGCDVIDAGLEPTPTLNIAVPKFKARGGIIVSASHNPKEYNGLKFFDSTGHYLDQKKLNKLLALSQKPNHAKITKLGIIRKINNLSALHIQKLGAITNPKINWQSRDKKIRVLVDAINGAGCNFLSHLFNELNCDRTIINDNPSKPFPHQPEPNFKNLKTVSKIMKGSRFDIGFATDPDCDRVIVLTPKQGVICEEYTIALCLLRLTQLHKKGKVIINFASSLLNEYIARQNGLEIVRVPVGEHNIYARMQKENAILGGEGNGGVMDPHINSTRDSFTGIVHILSLLAEIGQNIDQIIDSLPKFEIIKDKVPIANLDLKKTYHKIEKHFLKTNNPPRAISYEDGIWLGWNNQWVMFRPSNTEPIARVMAESLDILKTKKLIETIKEIL